MTFSISTAMTLRRVKSGLSKMLAEDALGQQVLDEHLLDRFDRQVGIDGLAAELVEGVEALDEGRIGLALLLDLLLDRLGDLRDVLLEFGDRCVPFLVVRLAIGEELLQQLDEVAGVAYVLVQSLTHAVLDRARPARAPEDDVVARVALSSLARISLSRSSCSSLASQKPRARRKVSSSAPSMRMG